jgi:3-oxoacyl-[acyl-carrier-protein] synthase-3
MSLRSVLIGCGSYLPEKILTNEEISQLVDTSPEWIVQRSGIERRHIAAKGEFTSDLATHAARDALHQGGLTADSIDMVLVATTTPDRVFPSVATKVQANLGMTQGFAFDIQAVCGGFVYALSVADAMIKAGTARRALVIGAETMSRIVDWTDRGTCCLFGDGAGAVILEGQSSEQAGERGVLGTNLYSDGRYEDILYVDGGPSLSQSSGVIKMAGREVFRHATLKMANAVTSILEKHNLSSLDLDWLIPHQANKRIMDGIAHHLSLPESKMVCTVQDHGNTSAASIPLAMAVAFKDGRLQPGQLILCDALGAGLTWASALIRL